MYAGMMNASKTLGDHFFFGESQVLREELKRLKKEKESIDALSKVSGIVNKEILKELVDKEIRPEMLAALCLVPIIEVAWADGVVDKKEEKAILDGAAKQGFGADVAILGEWLKQKPDQALWEAWVSYMNGLKETLRKECMDLLKINILEHATTVAKASGSFLGLTNPISTEEQKVLDRIEGAINQ